MAGGFRQAISGLHTWGGLVFGWLLMAVFVTGTICVFTGPITAWMSGTGEVHEHTLTVEQGERAIVQAVRHLERVAPDAREWNFYAPEGYVGWRDAEGAQREAHLDPATGQPRTPAQERGPGRETAGGHHFLAFHFSLHAGFPGILLVGFVTVAMLVALVSGVIVHKRIFSDFFTLRFGKGQRSWLDGHNVASVLTLPFQLMIAYTGLAIFMPVWMPSAIAYHYGMPGGLEAELQFTSPYAQALRSQKTDEAPAVGEVPLAVVPALARQASERSGRPVWQVMLSPDTQGDKRLWIFMPAEEGVPETLPPKAWLAFQGLGSPTPPGIQLRQEDRNPAGPADATLNAMGGLHRVQFGGWTAKWLWFLCGAAGCVMIATGLVLFTVKRRQRSGHEFGAATARVYRLIEALNVASIAGILLASIAYFWANRLIPADLPGRAEWEIRVFLLVWAATPVHALLRPARRAWVEQLGLGALLCLALPLLNLAATGDWFGVYAGRGDWRMFGVEAVTLALGALFAATAFQVAKARSSRARP